MSGGVDDAFVTEVRERCDIVAVVGDYVTLRKAGTHYKGLCPFHAEKSPSFTVQPTRQFFYCFGCQTGGDVITFVRELNGYSFMEALRHLADRAGMQVPDRKGYGGSGGPGDGGPRAKKRLSRQQKGDFYAIGALAQKFFADALDAMEGSACRDYLHQRQITRDTVRRFGLGFAPDRWDGLLNTLRAEGVDLARAEALGLIAPRKSGDGHYDRFRDRLMFPIRSIAGEIIAFGGRRLSADKEIAKYINSPESPIYTKGDTLFGLHEARAAMRREELAILVEGNIDLLKLAQAGIDHVVAPMGTALTSEQCRLLKRFVPRVVALYDGDDAGQAAAEKAVAEAISQGLQIAIATLPTGEDPDTYVSSQGVDALRALLARAIPGWEYVVMRTVDRTGARHGLAGKVRALDVLAPLLDIVDDRREKSLYRRHLQMALGIDESDLVRLLRDSSASSRRSPGSGEQASAPPRRPMTSVPAPRDELAIVQLIVFAPAAVPLLMAHDINELLTHSGVKDALEKLLTGWDDDNPGDLTLRIAEVEDANIKALLFECASGRSELDAEAAAANFYLLLGKLRRADVERRQEAIRRDERRATLEQDEDAQMRLMAQRLELEKARERL